VVVAPTADIESEHITASSSQAPATIRANEYALHLLVQDTQHITHGRTTINYLNHLQSSHGNRQAFRHHRDPTSHSTSNQAMTFTLRASHHPQMTKKIFFPCTPLTSARLHELHPQLLAIVSQTTVRSSPPSLQMMVQIFYST